MPENLSLSSALGHAMTDKRIDILRQIGAGGSISQAARAVGISYKAAWQAVDTLTNLAGTPLVARAVGGAGGGGAELTAAGHELLAAADAMAQARTAVLARWQSHPQTGAAAARLAVRTSMRNQWPCVVQGLQIAGQIALVDLVLSGTGAMTQPSAEPARDGSSQVVQPLIRSRITRESAELLGLAPGLAVQALCKATAVRVERSSAPVASMAVAALAGAFRLSAKAVRVSRGALGDEVAAQLPSGLQAVGFAAPESGLRAGSRVTLVVDDTAVVLAMTGE